MLSQTAKNLVLPVVALAGARRLRLAGGCLLLASLLTLATAAHGSQPMEDLKKSVDDGLRILQDPHYRPADRKAMQQQHLRQVLFRDFDFWEFSKRVLADRWGFFTDAQRSEFVDVFARFLADHYLARLQERYTDERVVVRGQKITAPGRAVVTSGVIWMNREFPVEVRMHARSGKWRIYDVSVIGISAVQIYRAQFQEIMRTHSPAQVIELIKRRNSE
ncbi:MAG TPA: ABC transporter substrate-binding protein [Desulfobacterales bacterium]|jgi:phospholipid transport system substrate-binding protein|nr:ABC transporter substrate-binding protein [Desulfobacterales bacterium]HSM89892.1 ABC transporter substrate-binding protein [Desulfobacterales bacterium]